MDMNLQGRSMSVAQAQQLWSFALGGRGWKERLRTARPIDCGGHASYARNWSSSALASL
jgi:hypothetical protein